MDMNELKAYSEFLNEVDKKRQHITQQWASETLQEDFWATVSSWKEAAPKFEDIHSFMVAYGPPIEFVTEHGELVSSDQDLLGALNIMLSSANLGSKTVNEVIFNAGQSKMESANKQVQETIQTLMNKVQGLLGH